MKKLLILLILFLNVSSAIAENANCIPLQDIRMGSSYDYIVNLLETQSVEYEEYRDIETNETSIYTHLEAFGCKDSYPSSFLYFDADGSLQIIEFSIDAETLMEAYSTASKFIGKADIISLPDYVDYEIGNSDIEYSFPLYVAWVKEDAIYELSMDSSIYTDIHTGLFDGLEIIADDNPSQYFGFSVYHPDRLNEVIRMYE